MPKALIVSPHFPPSSLAGVHRARHLVKHLPTYGWLPTVICVDPIHHIERLDPELADLVPANASIIKVGALPTSLTRPLGVAGDIGLRGLAHIRRSIAREMRKNRPSVVMITGSPYYPMLLAGWIERRWGVPVVLDFQDPWVTPVGAAAQRGTKAWLSHQLALFFEPKAVEHASFITSVSDQQNAELIDRYPSLAPLRLAGIPIGGDPDDFETANLNPTEQQVELRRRFSIVYTGTVWPAAVPIIDKFFNGLAMALELLKEDYEVIECIFMGTTANPNASNEHRVMPLVSNPLLARIIKEIPERRPYLQATQAMSNASVNLIIGSTEPHYTASKIYPILMANRPHLSVMHRKSSSHQILSKAGGGVALSFETPEELDKLPNKIANALVTLATKPNSIGRIDAKAYADYTASAVASRFASIFETLTEERASGQSRLANK